MPADVKVGSLVYIKNEGDKTRSRERYMIVKISGNTCKAIKLQKTNLPKKEYDLKLTEVFPVMSTLLFRYI